MRTDRRKSEEAQTYPLGNLEPLKSFEPTNSIERPL